MATSADTKAAPGSFELTGLDGSVLQVAATADSVTVYQAQAGTTGRGASVLTADEADQLAAALTNAGKASRDAAKAAAGAAEAADVAEDTAEADADAKAVAKAAAQKAADEAAQAVADFTAAHPDPLSPADQATKDGLVSAASVAAAAVPA